MENFLLKSANLFLQILIIFVIFKISNFTIKKIFKKIIFRAKNVDTEKQLLTLRSVIISAVDIIIVLIGLFHILIKLGIDVRPLIATAGVVGVAIGFGAKRLVEDILTGISLFLDGQIRVGDVVKIQQITGTVEKMSIKMVTLRDIDGTKHFIRNSMIDIVSNYTRDYSYAIFEIPIKYEENITKVIEIIKKLGVDFKNSTEYKNIIMGDLEIFGLDKFADNAIILKFRIKTLPAEQWQAHRAFNLLIKEKFDEQHIKFAQIQYVSRQD